MIIKNIQIQGVVNNLTGNGSQPIMTLLLTPGSSPTSTGHWVILKGLDSVGNMMISVLAGLKYTITPSNFGSSWVSGALVKPTK